MKSTVRIGVLSLVLVLACGCEPAIAPIDPVSRPAPDPTLAAAGEALADLRAGRFTGAAVIVP